MAWSLESLWPSTRYHKAARDIIKDKDNITMERMATAILNSNHRDLWAEVKKIKGRNSFVAASVDGFVGDDEIAEVFHDKYADLYNSVPYDSSELDLILQEIYSRLKTVENSLYTISFDDVNKAIIRLKRGKSDGEEGLNTDHIINGTDKLYMFLTKIFNIMLVHGYSPDSMLEGTMVPIPKGKGKPMNCSNNYRAITLSSIINKVFDWVLLIKEKSALQSSELQFGFKEHTSTTQCTFTLNEIISYYHSKRSDVYVLLLDASQAFDRVNFCKLFSKLLDRSIHPLLYAFCFTCIQIRNCRFGGQDLLVNSFQPAME